MWAARLRSDEDALELHWNSPLEAFIKRKGRQSHSTSHQALECLAPRERHDAPIAANIRMMQTDFLQGLAQRIIIPDSRIYRARKPVIPSYLLPLRPQLNPSCLFVRRETLCGADSR